MTKEAITKQIHDKVISKKDINSFWNLVKTEYERSNSEHKKIKLEINTCDDMKYESDGSDGDYYIKDESIIDQKKIDSLEIRFIDYRGDNGIKINFDSKYQRMNYFVEGQDSNWVSGVATKLDNIVSAIKRQNKFFHKNETFILIFTVVWMSYFLFNLYKILKDKVEPIISNIFNPSVSDLIFFLLIFIFVYVVFPGSLFLISKISKLWPSIEFDFGPEHDKKEKNIRKVWFILISFLLSPLLLNWLTNLPVKLGQ